VGLRDREAAEQQQPAGGVKGRVVSPTHRGTPIPFLRTRDPSRCRVQELVGVHESVNSRSSTKEQEIGRPWCKRPISRFQACKAPTKSGTPSRGTCTSKTRNFRSSMDTSSSVYALRSRAVGNIRRVDSRRGSKISWTPCLAARARTSAGHCQAVVL